VIYLAAQLYLSHGVDDVRGGKATVTKVFMRVIRGKPTPYIETAEDPGTSHNWEILAEQQAQLAAEFGDHWAHPDPDPCHEHNTWE
jgi:hypothetical protein